MIPAGVKHLEFMMTWQVLTYFMIPACPYLRLMNNFELGQALITFIMAWQVAGVNFVGYEVTHILTYAGGIINHWRQVFPNYKKAVIASLVTSIWLLAMKRITTNPEEKVTEDICAKKIQSLCGFGKLIRVYYLRPKDSAYPNFCAPVYKRTFPLQRLHLRTEIAKSVQCTMCSLSHKFWRRC